VDLVPRLAALVEELRREHGRVVVGIDGPDAAGKTTMADRLGAALPGSCRLSIDDFMRPRAERYGVGELDPEGYYRRSFDDDALLAAIHAAPSDVVVVDGVFLHRPSLRPAFTLTVYLRISDAEVLRRAVVRDTGVMGSSADVERRYTGRYLPGQALYRAEVDPESLADVLVDNEDATAPAVLRWGPGWPAASALHSARLGLEPLTVAHAAEMFPLLDDAELHRFTGGRPLTLEELVARHIRQVAGHSFDHREGWLNWVLRRRDTGQATGYVQATLTRGHDGLRAELAWVITPGQQHQGFATEAAAVVTEWLRRAGVTTCVAHIHPDHTASAEVARRLGLRPTASTRDGEVRWLDAAASRVLP
jgi:RimJ/RimL family protein N-acetyltransferase/uridine kinase